LGRTQSKQDVQALHARITELEQELQRLRANPEGDSRLAIEKAAQEQLALQVRSLERENTRLREELAFFDSLATTNGKSASLTINRFSVEPDAVSGQFRYRMLLSFQGDKKDREFKGVMQLLVHLQQDGKSAMITFPSGKDKDRQRFEISFRHYRRVDGQFEVPNGARVKSVEVRLIQDGVTKASQSVVL
jgi:cell division protein FtsB